MKTYCPVGRCECPLLFIYNWILRMAKQREEALSEANVYYFGIANKRKPNNKDELLEYYILNGGASGFAEREARRALRLAFDPII